ncbi:hypothetical protein C8R44DRAFT_877742 [Mycena epipterygia]|nr:hypothetical protein C8R44DRAFT_877742 [Mycena epipterygia]
MAPPCTGPIVLHRRRGLPSSTPSIPRRSSGARLLADWVSALRRSITIAIFGSSVPRAGVSSTSTARLTPAARSRLTPPLRLSRSSRSRLIFFAILALHDDLRSPTAISGILGDAQKHQDTRSLVDLLRDIAGTSLYPRTDTTQGVAGPRIIYFPSTGTQERDRCIDAIGGAPSRFFQPRGASFLARSLSRRRRGSRVSNRGEGRGERGHRRLGAAMGMGGRQQVRGSETIYAVMRARRGAKSRSTMTPCFFYAIGGGSVFPPSLLCVGLERAGRGSLPLVARMAYCDEDEFYVLVLLARAEPGEGAPVSWRLGWAVSRSTALFGTGTMKMHVCIHAQRALSLRPRAQMALYLRLHPRVAFPPRPTTTASSKLAPTPSPIASHPRLRWMDVSASSTFSPQRARAGRGDRGEACQGSRFPPASADDFPHTHPALASSFHPMSSSIPPLRPAWFAYPHQLPLSTGADRGCSQWTQWWGFWAGGF